MILINSSPKDALKIFQPFLPISVPVGIGFLVAAAEKEGIRVEILDEQIEEDVLARIAELTKKLPKPYIFGFSVLTAALKSALSLSQKLRELYPDSKIVFGGIHPTALPDEVLAYPQIDAVIRGEAEVSLMEFYRCVKAEKDYRQIYSLSYRKDGIIVHNEHLGIRADLTEDPPFPYHRFTDKRYDLGFVLSSRGCPYDCIFCSNRITTGKRYRYRPAAILAEEIAMLHEKYGRSLIGFMDDNFLVSKPRVYELIEAIKAKGLDQKVNFGFQARGDNVNETILKDLFDIGFRYIFFGMETASPEIMKTIKKGETVEDCVAAVKMAKKIGYHVSATFIYGLPGDSHKDRMDCVELSLALKIDMIRYNNATPYPGTELYEMAKRENRLHIQGVYENFMSVSTFIESPFKPIPFTYVPAGSTENEIRRDLLYSYFRFYFDVERMRQIFRKPEQNVGWFNAGNHLVDVLRKIPAVMLLAFFMFCKFLQLFNYCVIKRETRISLKFFFSVFKGLLGGGNRTETV
jgi:radical SAM superfamily enzyme YgiQ (UPF0313 family)